MFIVRTVQNSLVHSRKSTESFKFYSKWYKQLVVKYTAALVRYVLAQQ